MRRKDFSGEKVWMGAFWLMARWMESRFVERKISGDCRLVIRRVLLGGEGWLSAGRSERSSERLGDFVRRGLERGEELWECGGVEISMVIVVAIECEGLVDVGFCEGGGRASGG